jgi:hypothetical protein
MKKLHTLLIPVLFAVLGTTAWAAAEHLEIVSGKEWVSSSHEQKRAYLFGVGNVLQIERAMVGDGYQDMRGSSIVPVLLDGLSGVSLDNIVMQLDKYYADNPSQSKRPVIEVLYLEMALPNL